jgi:hypothetical protein
VAFEEMHVLDAAEVAVEGGGEDDDGDVGAAAAEERGDLGAELACAEVIVEDGDVDGVEELGGFFDGGGGGALVAVLAEDGGTEKQVCGLVIEQKDANGLGRRNLRPWGGVGAVVGRFRHRSSPYCLYG